MGFERNKKIMINFLVVLIIALAALSGYIILSNNSKFKVKAAIRYVFNHADATLELAENSPITNAFLENKVELTNRIIPKISLSNDTKQILGTAGKKIEDLVNNSTIDTNIKSDIVNKYMDLGINYTYNNEKIFTNSYISDNELYISIKDYFDKYLKNDTDDYDTDEFFNQITSGVRVDEIRYITNIVKKSLVDSIEFGQITSSKTEIDVYEEKLSVNKTTLTVDTNLKNKATTIFLNKVLHDEKAKQIVLKLSDSSVYPNIASLEDEIRDQLFNIETTTFDNEVLGEYSIYTSGLFSNVVRNEFKTIGNDESAIQITTYKTTVFDTQIAIYENNELTLQSNIKENSDDNYDITIISGQYMSLDIKGVISKQLTDVTYTLRIGGIDDVKGEFILQTNNISDRQINQTLNLKLNTPESYGTVNLTIETTIKIVDNIIKPDFSDSVSIGSLTTDQTNTIMTNFQNKNPKIIKTITDIINSLM